VLILSRREAERICLGDDIVLTIVALGNDRVRIGVQAPPGVRVLRGELEVESATLPAMPFVSETVEPNGMGSSRKAA
jgi:carbon storage regulator